ncbi:MAG: hypothetical protein AAF633_21155 [Chloroflexota bacterium]
MSSNSTSEIVEIPMGKQVITLSDDLQKQIHRIIGGQETLLASRVWVEERGGEFFLHIGDLRLAPRERNHL